MTAAARNASTAKKRKISEDRQPGITKKKSPLFNQPQNFYAPTSISSMTKDEVSEWRKEQRRKRNRDSAAASRNKTRAKIEELEGEVNKWKKMHHDMELKMRCMERHIQFLTKFKTSQDSVEQMRVMAAAQCPERPSAAVVSHPNSPPSSPPPSVNFPAVPVPAPVPNVVTSLLPPPPAYSSHHASHHVLPLSLKSQDYVKVETQIAAAAARPHRESMEHLTLIPRPAVKITGASYPDSSVDNVKQQQLSGLPSCDSGGSNEEGGEDRGIVDGGIPDELSDKAALTSGVNDHGTQDSVDRFAEKDNSFVNEEFGLTSADASSGDVLLDLLVDTLDGEFDPNLFI